jgi:hypothetical protein
MYKRDYIDDDVDVAIMPKVTKERRVVKYCRGKDN